MSAVDDIITRFAHLLQLVDARQGENANQELRYAVWSPLYLRNMYTRAYKNAPASKGRVWTFFMHPCLLKYILQS